MIRAIGVDFGTTNSVVALLHDDGRVATQRHAALDVFRSVLCFWTEETAARRVLRQEAGPEAIAAYLEDPLDSRLIMSMKTYLAQRSFSETRIFGHPFTLERLIGRFLAALLADTTSASRVIVGRPVRFAGELAAGLPSGKLKLLRGIRHMTFWEDPDLAWSEVQAFLPSA